MERVESPGAQPGRPPEEGLRIAVLGPLEVRDGGVDRTPTAPMPRRVLSVLLLHVNQTVPISVLIDELWDGVPPRQARKTVQTYVCQLRQLLRSSSTDPGREVLCTRPSGYLLRLAPEEFDLWAFERAVDSARSALRSGDYERVADLLRGALSRWRGGAFADVEVGPLLTARIAQLDEARIGAVELRVDADLRLGRHRELLGELGGLVARHPFHEEFTAQLMTAAYRAGQQGTALEAYARLRDRLIDGLGTEPSQRLRQLQRDVLRQAPSLDLRPSAVKPVALAPRPVPRIAHLPPDIDDFTGRHRELDRIVELSRDAPPTRLAPRLIVLTGAAGAGKSTLAIHAAQALKNRFPDGQLYAVLHDADDTPLDPVEVLWSLLRDTGTRPEDIPEGLEGRVRAFRSWSADRSLLMVLDDAASAAQLLPLLPGSGGSTVLVTSRVRTPGLPGARTLELGPLETGDALALLASLAGTGSVADDPRSARAIVRLCDHLPLAVRAAGEKRAARPMWSPADFVARLTDERRRLAELGSGGFDVRCQLARAVDRLPPTGRRALTLLSAAGPGPFDLSTAARLLGVDTVRAEAVAGDLLDYHVVTVEVAGPGQATRYRVPDLVRLAVTSADDTLHGGLSTPATPAEQAVVSALPGVGSGPPSQICSRVGAGRGPVRGRRPSRN